MPISIDHIIERLGGADAAARLTGVGTEAVRKWRQSRAIPSRHWPAVIAATGLTMADLQTASPDQASATDATTRPTPFPRAPPPSWCWRMAACSGAAASAPTPRQPQRRSGEVCFSTGMTGYQETLTDPSFAGQIITFTFPHIGNVGTNAEDIEATTIAARGLVVKQDITEPSNWRSTQTLEAWLRAQGITGIAGVDTRALTIRIRDGGAPTGVLAFPADGRFDLARPARPGRRHGRGWRGWTSRRRSPAARPIAGTRPPGPGPAGFGRQDAPKHHVVAVDYGAKRNILRCLASAGCRVTVVPATATADDILRHKPDGVFLSNGPGDPAATGVYAVPVLRGVLDSGVPVFGICLGHQLLALALGAKTYKLERGHRGANQPVKDLATGKVEITSQNHGFAVDDDVAAGERQGDARVAVRRLQRGHRLHRPAGVLGAVPSGGQPRAADSHHLFRRFVGMMERAA